MDHVRLQVSDGKAGENKYAYDFGLIVAKK